GASTAATTWSTAPASPSRSTPAGSRARTGRSRTTEWSRTSRCRCRRTPGSRARTRSCPAGSPRRSRCWRRSPPRSRPRCRRRASAPPRADAPARRRSLQRRRLRAPPAAAAPRIVRIRARNVQFVARILTTAVRVERGRAGRSRAGRSRADGPVPRARAEGPARPSGPGGQWPYPFAAPRPAGDALEGAPMTASDIDRRIADLPVAVDLTEDAVILEVDLSGTGAQIWEHLTDPELLATWSPIVPERPLTEPGPVLSRETPEAEPVAVDVLATAGDHALTHRWGDELLEWLIDEARLTLLMK